MYNEYRLIKATYHFIFERSICTGLDNGLFCPMPGSAVSVNATGAAPVQRAAVTSSPLMVLSWLREGNYNLPPFFNLANGVDQLLQFQNAKIRQITSGRFEMWISITADAGEKSWINTTQLPGVFPNEEFFCPILCTGINLPLAAEAGENEMSFQLDVTTVVEVRGIHMNNMIAP